MDAHGLHRSLVEVLVKNAGDDTRLMAGRPEHWKTSYRFLAARLLVTAVPSSVSLFEDDQWERDGHTIHRQIDALLRAAPSFTQRRSARGELQAVVASFPTAEERPDDYSRGMCKGFSELFRHLGQQARLAAVDDSDRLDRTMVNDLGVARAPLLLAGHPSLLHLGDSSFADRDLRRRIVDEALAARWPAGSPVFDQVASVLPFDSRQRSADQEHWRDVVRDDLRRLRATFGFHLGELHARFVIRRILEREARAATPAHVSFARTFGGGYDEAHSYVARKLKTRAIGICPVEYPSAANSVEGGSYLLRDY